MNPQTEPKMSSIMIMRDGSHLDAVDPHCSCSTSIKIIHHTLTRYACLENVLTLCHSVSGQGRHGGEVRRGVMVSEE